MDTNGYLQLLAPDFAGGSPFTMAGLSLLVPGARPSFGPWNQLLFSLRRPCVSSPPSYIFLVPCRCSAASFVPSPPLTLELLSDPPPTSAYSSHSRSHIILNLDSRIYSAFSFVSRTPLCSSPRSSRPPTVSVDGDVDPGMGIPQDEGGRVVGMGGEINIMGLG